MEFRQRLFIFLKPSINDAEVRNQKQNARSDRITSNEETEISNPIYLNSSICQFTSLTNYILFVLCSYFLKKIIHFSLDFNLFSFDIKKNKVLSTILDFRE